MVVAANDWTVRGIVVKDLGLFHATASVKCD